MAARPAQRQSAIKDRRIGLPEGAGVGTGGGAGRVLVLEREDIGSGKMERQKRRGNCPGASKSFANREGLLPGQCPQVVITCRVDRKQVADALGLNVTIAVERVAQVGSAMTSQRHMTVRNGRSAG